MRNLKYLIKQRLPVLGSSVLPSLGEILGDPEVPASTRYLAAWVALVVGDRGACVDILVGEVAADTEWSLPAASTLARHGVGDSASVIADALARVDPSDSIAVLQYATALRDLGGRLSPLVRRRILSESPQWVARAIASDFPAE